MPWETLVKQNFTRYAKVRVDVNTFVYKEPYRNVFDIIFETIFENQVGDCWNMCETWELKD